MCVAEAGMRWLALPTCRICQRPVGWEYYKIFDHVTCQPPVRDPEMVPVVPLDIGPLPPVNVLKETPQISHAQVAEVHRLKPVPHERTAPPGHQRFGRRHKRWDEQKARRR